MEMNKIKNRILILIMIIVSALGIAYKVLAAPIVSKGTELPNGPPVWENQGMAEGIINSREHGYVAGDSKDAEHPPEGEGTEHFGNSSGVSGSGGGGNAGGGTWIGSIADFEEAVVSPESSFSPGPKGEIWYEDTCNYIDVLCNQRGTPLSGKNKYIEDYKATGNYWETHVVDFDTVTAYGYEKALEEIEKIAARDIAEQEYQEYYRTSSKYTGTPQTATPAEAFVLSEAINISGGGEYTPLQYAWWAVTGTGAGGNELSEAAFDFQNYINTATVSDVKGKTYAGYQGFNIDINPNFVSTSIEPTVSFNSQEQQYIIGPFKLDYIDYKPFSFINNLEIYADNSTTPIDKDNYSLATGSIENLIKMNEEYPSSGQEFYVILDYNENFRKITDIKVDFQYMNAGGRWTKYTGTYTKVCIQGHIYGSFDKALLDDAKRFRNDLGRCHLNLKIFEIYTPAALHGAGDPITNYDITIDQLDSMIVSMSALIGMSPDGGKKNTVTAYETIYIPAWWPKDFGYGVLKDDTGTGKAKWSRDKYYALKDARDSIRAREKNPNEVVPDSQKQYADDIDKLFDELPASKKPPEEEEILIASPVVFQIWKDLEYIDMGDETAQGQAVSGGAARWWEYETIHWKTQTVPESGQIKIVKETDGEAKDGDQFQFKLTVNNNGQTTTENLTITYKEGGDNSVLSQVYAWEEGQSAPTYTVEEINIPEGSTLQSIENASGSFVDGQTVVVKATNKIEEKYGNINISKQIEDTKLPDNQYSLVGQKFKFDLTLSSAEAEFSYGGQNYKVTKEKSVTIPIEVEAVSESASQAEKDAKTVKIENIKFYGDAPKYEIKEVFNDSTPKGAELIEITNDKGFIENNQTVNIVALNKYGGPPEDPKYNEGSVKVIKTLDGDSKFSDEDLENFKYQFKVRFYSDEGFTKPYVDSAGNEIPEEIITAKPARGDDGRWTWTAQSSTIKWLYGNNPYYTIEEIANCPMHQDDCEQDKCEYFAIAKFDKTLTQAQNAGKSSVVEVTDFGVKGRLNDEEIITGVFNVAIVNIPTTDDGEPHKGKITINKTVNHDLLKNMDFEFTVKVSGTFTYKGQDFKNQTIQLTTASGNTNGYNELPSAEDKNNDQLVVIKVDGTGKGTWTSEEFEWKGTAPEYSIEENLTGKTVTTETGEVCPIFSSGLPKKGVLNENKVGDKNHIIANVKNFINPTDTPPPPPGEEDPIYHAGKIHLIKKLEGAENATPDYINSLRFEFDLDIVNSANTAEPVEDSRIVLGTSAYPAKYDESTKTWYWEYISPKYVWKEGETLNYTLTEVGANRKGITFVSAQGDTGSSVSGQTITGQIKDSGEALNPEDIGPIKILTENTFINKIEEKVGHLAIEKVLTEDGLDVKQFKFKVTLSGTFFYDGQIIQGDHTFEVGGDAQEQLDDQGKWTSKDIKWFGMMPTYIVEELPNENAELIYVRGVTGGIKEDSVQTMTAYFLNEPNDIGGHLRITKNMTGEGISENELFEFKVTIQKAGKETLTNFVKIKAGETWTSGYVTWKEGESAPKYTVEEINIPEGSAFSSITTTNGTVNGQSVSGELVKDTDVAVVATNQLEEKHGNFRVSKKMVFNKLMDTAIAQKFTVDIKISGTFSANFDGKTVNIKDDSYTITTELGNDKTYESPEITWWGNNPPTITVTERLKEGWDRPEYSNNGDKGLTLVEGERMTVVITNRMNIELDLTMDLAGTVWEDVPQDPEGKNTKDSVTNGLIDGSERGLDGVEVYVYRVASQNGQEVKRELAVAYNNAYNSGSQYPIITSGGGNWKVTGLKVTGFTEAEKAAGYSTDAGYSIKYDVEFVYDGQTYEPTTLLSYDDGDKYSSADAATYAKMSPSDRMSNFKNSSLALDFNRQVVNDRIREIYGKLPIDGMGSTIGTVNGSEGSQDVFYEASVPSNEKVRVKSELQTTDSSGIAYDLFKTKARTSTAGLQFPVDNYYKLEYTNTTYTLNGVKQTYRAIYEHCLHINLGLVRREEVDVEATKDLYSAKVVVNGKEIDYKFNKLADIISQAQSQGLDRVEQMDLQTISYELGLYSTDYYYKAEIYKSNAEVYDNILAYYKSFNGKPVEDSEIEVYLTYKISLYNGSKEKYVVQVNTVDDYVETSLGAPIATEITKVIDDSEKVVAGPSYLTGTPEGTKEQDVSWKVTERAIKGSDGVTYNRTQTNLNNTRLESGQTKYIYVTYAVDKGTVGGVQDIIKLGQKSNVIEIANYSTFYKDGSCAGKIDRDSAPSNVNIRNYNDEKLWYEDDTDSAPILNLKLLQQNREVSGIAWEDSSNEEGIRDADEARIGGLTTELVEKIKLPQGVDGSGNVTYREYDFLWPTSEPLDCLGGNTLEYLTGFDSTTETSRTSFGEMVKDVTGNDVQRKTEVGQYRFIGIPTGDYVVRFLYGNDKSKLEDTKGITLESATALKEDGSRYSGDDKINTANYDGDQLGSTPAVYNGQDYKTTIYQKGFESVAIDSNSGYVSTENHDLTNEALAQADVSDARDNEARRLELIANSETITNKNASILATATDISADHNELYENYYMFADTAKINLDIEANDNLDGIQSEMIEGTYISNGSVNLAHATTNYIVNKIDVGLIERPENNIVLDKQIKDIKLTTNDQTVIFDASYDITYETVPLSEDITDKTVIGNVVSETGEEMYLIARVVLNMENSKGIDQLQAIDKNEIKPVDSDNTGTQNFRYINVDAEVLQGTTIELTYLISALNVGETDYTSEQIEQITNKTDSAEIKADLQELAKQAEEESRTLVGETPSLTIGKYIGTTYYTGKNYERTSPSGAKSTDVVVSSKVRQIIDYVDNDAVFTPEYNTTSNHMWRNTSINELAGNGYEDERLVAFEVIPELEILDKNNVSYVTAQRNNLVLSVDDQSEITDTVSSNAGFESKLVPYNTFVKNKENYKYSSNITLTITKTVSAQGDADNLAYDNLTEIVKLENSVGRKDITTVTGNVNPKFGEFVEALKERDSSATELVTFTPPTGIIAEEEIQTQALVLIALALGIVVVGIVVIKKKVLK